MIKPLDLKFIINGESKNIKTSIQHNPKYTLRNIALAYSKSRLYYKLEKDCIQFITLLRSNSEEYSVLTENDVEKFIGNKIEFYQELMYDTEESGSGMRIYSAIKTLEMEFWLNEIPKQHRASVLKYILTELKEENDNGEWIFDITEYIKRK